MQLYYDLVTDDFTTSPGKLIAQLPAKRAAYCPISLCFLRNRIQTTLPTGTQFYFTGKQQSYFDAGFAVEATAWTGPDENSNYNVLPSYDTVALNTLFGYTYPIIDTIPHVPSILLDGEIGWLKPGCAYWSKTPPWTLLVYNDVNKGIESSPIVATTFAKGTINIPAGQDYGQVTGLTLSGPPVQIFLTVKKNGAGQYNMFATTRNDGTITAAGFYFDLSGLTNDATYQVDYLAFS